MKRLVALHRVFFDKRSGKAERIEQFIAECNATLLPLGGRTWN
jgi:hypothetical protein